MAAEQVNEATASLISGSSGPVNIVNSNITIVNTVGESSKGEITWLQPEKLFFHKPIGENNKVFTGKQVLPYCCRDVAVKLIEFSERAKKEVSLLTKTRHPNIVQIYDAGEFVTPVRWMYIVMELCARNLRQYVKDFGGKPLDMKTFVSIFNQLLDGLEYLHDNKILHRDIKPDNILVTESEEMKFSDFGISKQIESDRAHVTQTKYGAGTDGYRPPESYQENAKLTTAADIFSLALVMIHLVSNGRHPFGSKPLDWRDNIRNNRNLNLSIISLDIPPSKKAQLTDLAGAMLKSEPRERPSVKQIKSHDFFKDASSTRVEDDEAAKSSHSKQMDAEANEKNLDQKDASSTRINGDEAAESHIKQMDAEASPKNLNQKDNASRSGPPLLPKPDVLKKGAKRPDAQSRSIDKRSLSEDHASRSRPPVLTKPEVLKKGAKRSDAPSISTDKRSLSEDAPSTRIKGDKAAESRSKQVGAEANQKNVDEKDTEDLQNILRVAEHQIAAGDDESAIERVGDFLSKQSRSAMDVKNMADDRKEKRHYVQAMILYKISHNLHKKEGRFSPDDELIKSCIEDMYSAVYLFVASGGLFRKIAVNFGAKFLEEMKEELHKVNNVSPEKRARFEAYRLSCIADIYLIIDEFEESIQFSEQGVNIIVQQFGEKASNYKLYGDLLDMLGAAYYESGRYSHAERRYVMSITVKENAPYYENEDERLKDMAITKRNLEETRMIKKQKYLTSRRRAFREKASTPSRGGYYSLSSSVEGSFDNLQASVPSPSGAIGTSTESRENLKQLLQDSTQLLEKEEFQYILLLVEFQLAEGDEESAIERVGDFLSKESSSAMDVKNLADDLEVQCCYVQAMILYKLSHKLHKKDGRFSPDDELEWINGRILDIYQIIIPLIEAGGTSRKIALNIGVKFLHEFLEEIREVTNANLDSRARFESGCLARIADVHYRADEFEECIQFGVDGLKIMTQQFGENASNYRLYGLMLHNLAAAYHDSGRYSDGESCFITALEIHNKASDYKNEKVREDFVALAKRCLEKIRSKSTS